MKVTDYVKGRTVKTVTIEGVSVQTEDSELKTLAMQHAGETHSSLFGTRVKRNGSTAVVELHTD